MPSALRRDFFVTDDSGFGTNPLFFPLKIGISILLAAGRKIELPILISFTYPFSISSIRLIKPVEGLPTLPIVSYNLVIVVLSSATVAESRISVHPKTFLPFTLIVYKINPSGHGCVASILTTS